MHHVSLNVFDLVRDLEKKTGERWSLDKLASSSGISRPTWARLESPSAEPPRRIEFGTLASLLDFFHAQGMPITIADLFIVTADD